MFSKQSLDKNLIDEAAIIDCVKKDKQRTAPFYTTQRIAATRRTKNSNTVGYGLK